MKFWNKAEDALYIYGDIVNDKWTDNDVTAKSFVDDLKSYGDKSVELHINSSGGDVFTALAISNIIKARGNVNIIIDGICASAATLIAVAGQHISMANNALFMIHKPASFLLGYFDSGELWRVHESLEAVEDTILQTYKNRPLSEDTNLQDMIDAETWMTASEAKDYGFIDEVTGASELEFNDNTHCLFVNKVAVDCRNVRNEIFASIRKVNTDMQTEINAAIQAERKRISDLTSMKGENAAVNALLDLAIADGKSVEEIKPYMEAVAKAQPENKKDYEAIAAMIRDQLGSGAEGVTASTTDAAAEKQQAAVERLVNAANAMMR